MPATYVLGKGSTLQTPAGADATIFALSMLPGKSAIAVVRALGPAFLAVCTLCNLLIYLQLIEVCGELEAQIDSSKDQSFEVPSRELLASVTHGVKHLRQRMRAFAKNAERGGLLRD